MTMIPVQVDTRVQSATHASFELDCEPLFTIRKESREWQLKADFEVSDREPLVDAWRTVDSYLVAMSMVCEGVFARGVWTPRGALGGVTFPAARPRELWAVGGLTVTPTQGIEQSKSGEVIRLAAQVSERAAEDDGAFAALTMYSAASWFLTTNLMREAALNYFAAVETVAGELLPGVRNKAVYQWGEIVRALKPLSLSREDLAVLLDGYKQRGESAHGKSSQLILAQHSLGVYPATSYSLKLPALACKAAADVVFRKYFTSREVG
jgi:hypothetical protein